MPKILTFRIQPHIHPHSILTFLVGKQIDFLLKKVDFAYFRRVISLEQSGRLSLISHRPLNSHTIEGSREKCIANKNSKKKREVLQLHRRQSHV